MSYDLSLHNMLMVEGHGQYLWSYGSLEVVWPITSVWGLDSKMRNF
jgi:hypothetical protein